MAHPQTPWLIQLCVQKVKTIEVGACSMACSTLGIKGHAGAPGWGLGKVTSKSITHTDMHNQTTSWLVHSWSIFGAWMSHKQTQNHKTHHGSNLGETTTFPLIVFSVPGHGANTQMSFCPEIPKLESWNFSKCDRAPYYNVNKHPKNAKRQRKKTM
jgi:hypothetical protein